MQIGQLLLVGVKGFSLTTEEKKFLSENQISGVTLFSRNVQSPEQIRQLCEEIQACAPKNSPMLISVDNEGGRVLRLKSPFTEWPALKLLGDLDSPHMTYLFSQFMGYELKAVGINGDWAPCVDVFTNPKNTVIGDRAISQDFETVAKHTSALIRGYLRAGIAPCAKHFPGHGHTLVDSHDDLPEEDLDLARLKNLELVPFRQAILCGVPLIMTGHLKMKNIDPHWPVTLSPLFLQKILREEMGFEGLIVTDDLDMQALKKHFPMETRVLQSLKAGADYFLFCNEPDSPPQALEIFKKALRDGEISEARLRQSYDRVQKFKKTYLTQTTPNVDWREVVGSPPHQALAEHIRQGRVGLAQS